MKKSKTVILVLSFMLTYSITEAQGINFETRDWASVQKQAKAANKLIFIDVYTTWCGPCKWMDKNVFKHKAVGDYFNAHFINYKLDAEKGEGVALNKKYGVSSYPHLLFVDANGKLVIRHSGKLDVNQMLAFGEKAMHSEKEILSMTSEYNKGNRIPEFILKYLAFLKERDLPTEAILISYLEGVEKEQWLSKENMRLIKKYIHNPYNKVIEYVLEQDLSNNANYKMNIDPMLNSIYKQYLGYIIKERRTPEEISKLLSHAKYNLNSNDFAYLKYRSNMLTAKRDEDWVSYTIHIIKYVNAYVGQSTALNNYAWEFYDNANITDPKDLNEALGWVNRALEQNMDYNILDTKAALLYKLGRNEEALKTANNAVVLAKKVGGNASATLKLIEKIKEQL